MYQVETLDARRLSISDAGGIAALLVQVWPRADKPFEFRKRQMLQLARGYTGPDERAPRSVIIRGPEGIIAHAAMIPRTIGTSKGEMSVAGLSRVCCDPSLRGKGLGELVVREVFSLVDREIFPFSLFQTSHLVQPFYERLGAVTAQNKFVNSLAEDPRADPFWDDVVLRYPKNRDWPEGEIDLRGPGF